MTGVAMSLGAVMLVGWLMATASGPAGYAHFSGFADSVVGKLLIAGWIFGFFYHLCNGIRHLFWDAGKGFEMSTARASGGVVIGASAGLTLLMWLWLFTS